MFQRILVPVDGSSTSTLALRAAIGLAKTLESQLRVIHLLEDGTSLMMGDPTGASAAAFSGELAGVLREAGQRILGDATALARSEGVRVDDVLVDQAGERLGETVAHAARMWEADLVVVGTHGRRGFSRLLLGSGAEQILRLVTVPVLTIRGPEATGAEPR